MEGILIIEYCFCRVLGRVFIFYCNGFLCLLFRVKASERQAEEAVSFKLVTQSAALWIFSFLSIRCLITGVVCLRNMHWNNWHVQWRGLRTIYRMHRVIGRCIHWKRVTYDGIATWYAKKLILLGWVLSCNMIERWRTGSLWVLARCISCWANWFRSLLTLHG